jgi:hypothetical protein
LVIGYSPQELPREHPELVEGCGFARAAPPSTTLRTSFDELRMLS